jgi:Ca2+-transporting ATPase
MEMFMAAVALAVSAIPEGLPAIMTITLAIGVKRMAARHAIIRKLPAVETLGSTTVICSDKTGTLTRNEMTVTAIEAIEGRVDVTGVGYAPTGSLVRPEGSGPAGMELPSLGELLAGSVLCSDATVRHEDGKWRITGDPTEAALVVLAEKAGVAAEGLRRWSPRLDVVPFDSESQLMATLNEAPGGERTIYLKGAPEVVLPRCASEWGTRAALSTHAWE